ncbi:uncharacterized protein LOC116990161 [Amblyraja radiata]|uniref:uncharacterized protein LOC116990161 n=1 Tax=Amblyraja radiata TaxID=386614 RepID=UPI0014038EE5|nr:uncharacterized protein LOC116990161 [Amblyraja radiata]
MWLPCVLTLLCFGLGATVEWMELFGIIGSSIFLKTEYQEDLSKNEILWTFISGDKSSVTILDHIPDKPTEYTSEQFKDRLKFHAVHGGVEITTLKREDQGNYTFRLNGQDKIIIGLFLYEHHKTNISSLPMSSVSFPGIHKAEKCSAKVIMWKKSSEKKKKGKSRETVLELHTKSTKSVISPHYMGRLNFKDDASFILHNLTSEDEGVYELCLNKAETIVQTVVLKIMGVSSKDSTINIELLALLILPFAVIVIILVCLRSQIKTGICQIFNISIISMFTFLLLDGC